MRYIDAVSRAATVVAVLAVAAPAVAMPTHRATALAPSDSRYAEDQNRLLVEQRADLPAPLVPRWYAAGAPSTTAQGGRSASPARGP